MPTEDQPTFHHFNDKENRDGSKDLHTYGSASPISRHVEGSPMDVRQIEGGDEKGMTELNYPASMPDFTSVDMMVPEALKSEDGENSAREMWLGHEFPDCKAFRRGL